jgi:hypothetical protein
VSLCDLIYSTPFIKIRGSSKGWGSKFALRKTLFILMNGVPYGKFIRRLLSMTDGSLCIYREPRKQRSVIVQSPPTSRHSIGPALANHGQASSHPSSRDGELTNRKEAGERVCTHCERCKPTSSSYSSSIPVLMLEQLMSEKLSRQGQEIATRLGALGQYLMAKPCRRRNFA